VLANIDMRIIRKPSWAAVALNARRAVNNCVPTGRTSGVRQ